MLSNLITTVNRHQWMSVAAYFIAETRGVESGKELDDWLASENELAEIIQQLKFPNY